MPYLAIYSICALVIFPAIGYIGWRYISKINFTSQAEKDFNEHH